MIQREDRGSVAVLRIEHGKVNALDTDFFDALEDQLDFLEISDHRSVVLTGTGRSFSAGVDLNQVLDGGVPYLREFLPALSKGLRKLFTFPRPVVAALNGHAIAGGCLLALACDYRVLTESGAKLGVTELQVGVPFPVAAMEVLRFQVGDRVTHDLAYSGRLIDPQEALRLGLVDRLAAPEAVLDQALEVAADYGRRPASAFGLTKRQLRYELVDRIQQQELLLEDEIAQHWSQPQTMAAIRAFLQAAAGTSPRR
ncbi:MAG: enoyl-CoA hydratase/isomerase family protein [Acidobacteriota bacterium]